MKPSPWLQSRSRLLIINFWGGCLRKCSVMLLTRGIESRLLSDSNLIPHFCYLSVAVVFLTFYLENRLLGFHWMEDQWGVTWGGSGRGVGSHKGTRHDLHLSEGTHLWWGCLTNDVTIWQEEDSTEMADDLVAAASRNLFEWICCFCIGLPLSNPSLSLFSHLIAH